MPSLMKRLLYLSLILNGFFAVAIGAMIYWSPPDFETQLTERLLLSSGGDASKAQVEPPDYQVGENERQANRADGIVEGDYRISFGISDMMYSQDVTILNMERDERFSSGMLYFDVILDKQGSLNSDGTRKIHVHGVINENTFQFILPQANFNGSSAYYFEGQNAIKDGVLSGTGDVPGQGPNCGNNKFTFRMALKDSLNAIPENTSTFTSRGPASPYGRPPD